jgi:hypothetical protein
MIRLHGPPHGGGDLGVDGLELSDDLLILGRRRAKGLLVERFQILPLVGSCEDGDRLSERSVVGRYRTLVGPVHAGRETARLTQTPVGLP